MTSWQPYDPSWLVRLAREHYPEVPWLATALEKCTRCKIKSKAYVCFVDPTNANQLGADWQFAENIVLEDPEHGDIVIDVLENQRIGGVEFLDQL